MPYIISVRGDTNQRVWKQVAEIVRESSGVRLVLQDYTQLVIPDDTLAQINSARPMQKTKQTKKEKK